ncbi:MAG: thiamine pyrophosphate-binding protein, partial [Candidatus Omnitrophica bacterium]|nr:thiamine pyrophosphate-binding protein [Candidatus Omnitrophota bacterium]
HLEKAVYLAKTGRPGPVWLAIPLDVQASIVDEKNLRGFNPSELQQNSKEKNLKDKIEKIIKLLNNSERPVILAGNGIRLASALEDFLKLIDYLNIPVLTTWRAIDFLPEKHPLFFGRPGSIASRYANFILQNSDLFISIGARLDLAQVGYNYKNFARFAKKVIVDIDREEIKKIKAKIDIPLCIDAKIFIKELWKNRKKIIKKERPRWFDYCKRMKKKYPVVLPEYRKEKKYVNTYILIEVLSDLMKEGEILIPGSSGSCSEITLQTFKVKKGQRIFNNPGLGAMGFGLPASIGACLASGKRQVISIIGDGDLQLNIQELETIRRLKLPIKIFVLNNNGYASIRHTQKIYFNGHLVGADSSSGLTLPPLSKIVYAYGLKYDKITNHKNIKEKVRKILNINGTVICEVMVDPNLLTLPRISSQIKSNGNMISKPLEDLFPFLEREELEANLFINN